MIYNEPYDVPSENARLVFGWSGWGYPLFPQARAGQAVQARGTLAADTREHAVYLHLCGKAAEKGTLACTVSPTLVCMAFGTRP